MSEESNGEGTGVRLITLYTQVLLELAKNPKISQEGLARKLDVTMRTAQRHLTDLENEGYIHVDRSRKPFRYSIDWTKPVPNLPGIRIIVFNPEVRSALESLSDAATQTYERAQQSGGNVDEALRSLLQSREGAPVG